MNLIDAIRRLRELIRRHHKPLPPGPLGSAGNPRSVQSRGSNDGTVQKRGKRRTDGGGSKPKGIKNALVTAFDTTLAVVVVSLVASA